MTKGILIYALGHVNYYHMAEVLAASLICNKRPNDGITIAVVCDDPEKFLHPALFNDIILLPKEVFMVDGKVVFNNATVKVYDLSPFDITIKLDADMVWLNNRSPADLFHSLRNEDLTFETTGFSTLDKVERARFVWAPPEEVQAAYGFTGEEKCYNIFGEFVYFKKTDENKNFFALVNAIYDHPKVECHAFSNGTFTDELAIQIAQMITKRYPHKEVYTPIFNIFLKYKDLLTKHAYQLPPEFYAYSIGGNFTNAWQKQQYNNLASHYFKTLGLVNPYIAAHKKSFLEERQKL